MRGYVTLGLLLALVTAQQGAVLHELSHLSGSGLRAIRVDAGAVAEKACELCLAYSQVANPASHSIQIPHFVTAAPPLCSAPHCALIQQDAPTPRSRGPPPAA